MANSTKDSGTVIRRCNPQGHTTSEEIINTKDFMPPYNQTGARKLVQVNTPCESEFQDERYGKGLRVMNKNEKGGCTCTICGRVHGDQKDAPVAVDTKGKKGKK